MENGINSYRRFLEGDNEGLEELVRDYQSGLILYINCIVHNIEAAKELSEETFVKLYVKRPKDNEKHSIHIRAHNHYIYKLIETKKIHSTQETLTPFGMHEDGEYGEVVVTVELNNEFVGRILQMGAGLEIVSPTEIRDEFKQRVSELYQLYSTDNE